MSSRAPIETLENFNTKENDNGPKKVSDYEQSREQRIKENLQRMQKLGILDLSLQVKSLKPTPKITKHRRISPATSPSPLPPSGPVRRSSRLQNATPVTYSEVHLAKKDKSLELEDDLAREVGSKPEVYTEEHEKLLGNTERSWTLFVDGVGKDGKRIYDPVRGKTCHQCRQKTLGYRTHCSRCNMVQGQFCGDCLYMRYGEHVVETMENPNWICPVCRGICNCSLCRQAKGWPPTGPLYRKISKLGYKSVAHYLIQTRRSDENVGTKVPLSAKRSLPFSDTEATVAEDDLAKVDSLLEEKVKEVDSNTKKVEEIESNAGHVETNVATVNGEHNESNMKLINLVQSNNVDIVLKPENHKKDIDIVGNEVNLGMSISEPENIEKEDDISCTMEVNSPKSRKKRACATKLTSDSIAGRLRQRRVM